MLAVAIIFWLCAALIVWTQLGYALALALIARLPRHAAGSPRQRPRRSPGRGVADTDPPASERPPSVSLIVAAHDEREVIGEKVANALTLDYPRERLEVIVACDGCSDDTAQRARDAGADVVLELPRGGKIRAQDAAVQAARGEIVAFSDANSSWEPDALSALVGAFEDPAVGYACGQVRFVQAAAGAHADNQEGIYWRYEMAVRSLESRLSSVTAGNGAIYATRREDYIVVDPIMGHDLSFPFNMVKRGRRAVYVPAARAREKMVPSLLGEFARKRRMMSHTWPILLRGGMLRPHGYTPGYAAMIVSHRLLRYCTPALHAVRACVQHRARCRRLGPGVRGHARAAAGTARRRAARRRAARGTVADRALLRAHDRLAGCGPVGLAASRHGRLLGGGAGHAMIRRLLDIAVSSALLALSSPIIVLAMIAIRLESPGPAIYRQRRVGRHGEPFDVLKLRTMVDGAEHIGAGLAVNENDSRITRVGELLRRSSLDELPNLLNVLRGDMSLIGPRPTIPVQASSYSERQRGRLAIRPGITGWAQVNGRASLPWSERIELDLYYIEHRSLSLDLEILRRTPALVLGGSGLYKGASGGWEGKL